MKAAVYYNTGRIRLEEVEIPKIRRNEVLVSVEACGVCGTDFRIVEGKAPAAGKVILGHEFAGIIVETGQDVIGFRVGQKVAVNPNIHCGKCEFCQSGRIHLCANLLAIGVTINGGFAEYAAVPDMQLYTLDQSIPSYKAAFAEPVSCCIHGIDQADIKINDTVAIIGAGAIGLIMLQLVKLKGAAKILIIETDPEKQKLAAEFIADVVLNPADNNFQIEINEQFPDGIDKVFECAGNAMAAETAISISKKGGTVVIFGLAGAGESISINLQSFFHKELTLKSSLLNPNTFQTAVNLLSTGKINVENFKIKYLSLLDESVSSLFSEGRDKSILKYMTINEK